MPFLQLALRIVPVILLAVLVCVVVAVPVAVAARTEQSATKTYRVYGATENAIRASIDARRPGDHDANTKWYVTWSYTSVVRDDRCRVGTSKVHTKIDYTYPRWVAPASASKALRTKWNRYMSRLRFHEAGHARIGRATAARIQYTLNVTTAADCAALDRSLKSIVARHFRTGNAQDVAYDRRTDHGATQGAVFP